MNAEKCCDVDKFVKAMADETRQRILEELKIGEMCVSELTSRIKLTQPTVSHHLSVLQNAKLVFSRREGKYIFYRINQQCIAEGCQGILTQINAQSKQET